MRYLVIVFMFLSINVFAKPTYTKVDNSMKVEETKNVTTTDTYSLSSLKDKKAMWTTRKAAIQVKIDALDVLITEATKLGLIVPVAEEEN